MIKEIRVEYVGKFGDDIRTVIHEMIEHRTKISFAHNCKDVVVYTMFNDVLIEVNKETTLDMAVEAYHKSFYKECYKEYIKENIDEKLDLVRIRYEETIDAIKSVDWIISCYNPIIYAEHVLMCAKKGYFRKKHCLEYISISALLGKMEIMNETYPILTKDFKDTVIIGPNLSLYYNVYLTLKKYNYCPEEVVECYKF